MRPQPGRDKSSALTCPAKEVDRLGMRGTRDSKSLCTEKSGMTGSEYQGWELGDQERGWAQGPLQDPS